MNRRRLLQLTALAAPAALAPGCFGSFALTRTFYGFNRSISGSKFVQWLVFVVMVVLPVYEVGLIIDVLILNTLEFWGLGNPLAQHDPDDLEQERRVALTSDTTLHLERLGPDRIALRIERLGHDPVELILQADDQGLQARDDDRLVVATREATDGALILEGPQLPPRRIPTHERQALLARWEQQGARGAAAYAAEARSKQEAVAWAR